MSEHELTQLLHDVTPPPPVSIDFEQVAAGARSRQRFQLAAAVAGTVVVVGAAVAVSALLGGGGNERIVPAGPATRTVQPSVKTPQAVLDAVRALRSDVISTGPVSTVWVAMTWGQWQRLDGSFTDAPGHDADPVYVIQLRSASEMTCRSCKGVTARSSRGRFATVVVPQHTSEGTDSMFSIGNKDVGLAHRPGVHILGADLASTASGDTARALCEQALGSAVTAASAITVGDARGWERGGPAPLTPAEAADRRPARNAWPSANNSDPAAWCTTGTGGDYVFYAAGPDGTAIRLEEVSGLGPTPPAAPFPIP